MLQPSNSFLANLTFSVRIKLGSGKSYTIIISLHAIQAVSRIYVSHYRGTGTHLNIWKLCTTTFITHFNKTNLFTTTHRESIEGAEPRTANTVSFICPHPFYLMLCMLCFCSHKFVMNCEYFNSLPGYNHGIESLWPYSQLGHNNLWMEMLCKGPVILERNEQRESGILGTKSATHWWLGMEP